MSTQFPEVCSLQFCGAKAMVLAELRDRGFPVPAFEVSPRDLNSTLKRLGTPLAVRSCATVEDGSHASFAGQFETVLDVNTAEELEQAVSICQAWRDSPAIHQYCRHHHIDPAAINMNVIVQRMVAATLSGVAFSIDPVSGADRVVIEACTGTGAQLMAGQCRPLAPDHPLLGRWRPEIEKIALDVQRHYGAPQDIEFACDDQRLWLLQARPITRIGFAPNVGTWTNADFRDGGVAASVCSPLMWSLYERAWRDSLLGFLREIRLLRRDQEFETGRMFFGRPYWNLGAVKRCLAALPGYVERRFDEDLSVEPTYEGDGETTPVTLGTIARALPTAWALRRFFRRHERYIRRFLTDGFEARIQHYQTLAEEPSHRWQQLVGELFQQTECAYFRTIFAASLARLDFKDAFPDADETALITGLGPLRHLAPLRHIRSMQSCCEQDVQDLLYRFRHHQPAGLDVIHPRWDEQRDYVERLLEATWNQRPSVQQHAPCESRASVARAAYLARLPRRRHRAFHRKLDRLRTFLFLREEMRDCSSRVYYLIRRSALAIGAQHVLGDDVFFMTVEEVSAGDRSSVDARRDVYRRYRNFAAPHEIGNNLDLRPRGNWPGTQPVLHGLAAATGSASGLARVVRSAAEATQLEAGAIIVCPFVDPGWTCVLDRVAAVVTETGGLLSHAAVICREFGLPTVLGVRDATLRIRSGDAITVDGDRGTVQLIQTDRN